MTDKTYVTAGDQFAEPHCCTCRFDGLGALIEGTICVPHADQQRELADRRAELGRVRNCIHALMHSCPTNPEVVRIAVELNSLISESRLAAHTEREGAEPVAWYWHADSGRVCIADEPPDLGSPHWKKGSPVYAHPAPSAASGLTDQGIAVTQAGQTEFRTAPSQEGRAAGPTFTASELVALSEELEDYALTPNKLRDGGELICMLRSAIALRSRPAQVDK